MSKLISRLHQHELHNTAHYQPYLSRYHKDDFKAVDHYRHLRQILPIYEALEKKICHESFSPKIPAELAFVLRRSEEINKDLEFLKQHVPTKYHEETLATTQLYVNQLEKLDPEKTEDQQEIFSHFLIRILGDLFGGQGLKKCAIDAYEKESIYDSSKPESGSDFYNFPKNALKEFSTWLNQLNLTNEDDIVNIATDAYQKHIDIFAELESTRVALASNSIYNLAQNASSFFNCRNLTKAVGVMGLAVIGACVVASTVNRLGS